MYRARARLGYLAGLARSVARHDMSTLGVSLDGTDAPVTHASGNASGHSVSGGGTPSGSRDKAKKQQPSRDLVNRITSELRDHRSSV